MWIGGLVLGGAAVATAVFFIAKPVVNTSPFSNGVGTFWWSLTAAQQATYKQDLWSKLSAVSPWPSNVQTLSAAGINSQSDLDNLSNLTAATDAYQTINNLPQQDGGVDQTTFNSVTS